MKVRELKERLATADLEAVVQIHVKCDTDDAGAIWWHGKPLEEVIVHLDNPQLTVVELR